MLLGAAAWIASVAASATALAEAARRYERRRLRRSIANALAHDLRTPLAQIQLSSDLLQRDGATDERSRRWLGVIGRETRRLADRVGAVLLLVGDQEGGLVMLPRPVELSELLRELGESVAGEAAARGVALELDLTEVLVQADPQPVRQVIAMLLDAAIAAASPGDYVRLTLRQRGRAGVLRLTSPGHGIRRRPAALALDVARIVARAHHGVASRADDGYVLSLPLAPTPQATPAHG